MSEMKSEDLVHSEAVHMLGEGDIEIALEVELSVSILLSPQFQRPLQRRGLHTHHIEHR